MVILIAGNFYYEMDNKNWEYLILVLEIFNFKLSAKFQLRPDNGTQKILGFWVSRFLKFRFIYTIRFVSSSWSLISHALVLKGLFSKVIGL